MFYFVATFFFYQAGISPAFHFLSVGSKKIKKGQIPGKNKKKFKKIQKRTHFKMMASTDDLKKNNKVKKIKRNFCYTVRKSENEKLTINLTFDELYEKRRPNENAGKASLTTEWRSVHTKKNNVTIKKNYQTD